MANKTVYPFGLGGSLPARIAIADDLVTNSAQMALSAKQGKVLGDAIWGEAGVETITLGLADADVAFTYPTPGQTPPVQETQQVTSADRIHLIYSIPTGATITISCNLNSGVAVMLYDTREKCLVSTTNYLETYTNYAYATSVNGVSTQAGYLNILYKNASGSTLSQQDYEAFMAAVQVEISWTEINRGDGIMIQLQELQAKGVSDGGSLLYVGPVESGVRGAKYISSSGTAVTMSNTVGVPFEKCKVKAYLPDGIVAAFMVGATSETLSSGSTVENGEEYQFPANVEYYCINFSKDGGTLDEDDVQGYVNSGRISFRIVNGESSTIQERNAYNENFARAPMRRGVLSGYGEYMSLAHISDVHGDAERVKSFFAMAQHLGVQYAVNTGDVVGFPYNGFSFFKDLSAIYNGKTINVQGNHDVFDISDADAFNANIKPFTDALGISTDKNYFYYDDTTYKVRFIVLDAFENASSLGYNKANITGTQMLWFIVTLASVPAEYGVILCYHIPAYTIVSNNLGFYQDTVTVFHTLDDYGTGVKNQPIQKIVNAFIRKEAITGTYTSHGTSYSYSADFTSVPSSAEFICHLTGHEHSDRVGYYTGYDGTVEGQEKQLVFNVCTGNALYGTAYPYLAHLSDCPRGGLGSVQDAFNILTIFRSTKKIQCTRIGSFITGDGTERLTATFDYA